MKENPLQIIVKESGLESTKAKYILEQFQDYFQLASEWEVKAKSIVVTKETQTAEMDMARTGRLFLREKRIREKRIYYLVYEDLKLVLLVATSGKKDQQATIGHIKDNLDQFKIIAEQIARQLS